MFERTRATPGHLCVDKVQHCTQQDQMPQHCASILTLVRCHLLACVQVSLCRVVAKLPLWLSLCYRILCWLTVRRIAKPLGFAWRGEVLGNCGTMTSSSFSELLLLSHAGPAIPSLYRSVASWMLGRTQNSRRGININTFLTR